MKKLEIVPCGRCGRNTIREVLQDTGERFHHCVFCGFTDNRIIRKNDEGELVRDKNCMAMYDYNFIRGYGVAMYIGSEGIQRTPFEKPITVEDIDAFHHKLVNDESLYKKDCYLTAWDETGERLLFLFGRQPQEASSPVSQVLDDESSSEPAEFDEIPF